MMTDAASMLQAILNDPNADGPRLAYADWLAQHGNPADRARAEFIHLQIEIERLRDDDRRWPEAARKERELLEQYRSAWERPLRKVVRPSASALGGWLKARIFGAGGHWQFHRGFIEEISTSADHFFREDIHLFGHSPVRRVVLSNASAMIVPLLREPKLDRLYSFHLISDAEMDDDMEVLVSQCRSEGVRVIEVRYPRVQSDADVLFSLLKGNPETDASLAEQLEKHTNWSRALPKERERLRELARIPRFLQRLTEPENTSHSELLRVNDWIYLGDRLRTAGVWAVAKTFHDLEDDKGYCRRLALFKPDQLSSEAAAAIRESPHFHGELT